MDIKTDSHTPLNALQNPAVNGTKATEGVLEKSTRKRGLRLFLTVARDKDVKMDSKKLTYGFITSLFIQIVSFFTSTFAQ